MNKAALKRFATAARIELLERVELQARKYGITKETIQDKEVINSDDFFINGKPLTPSEKVQRNKLISRIKEISFDRVMDEVAYTWFNRFTALRFMEVNDYLPTKIRVLSSNHEDSNEPEMIKEALSLDLDLDKEYVYDLRMNNKTEELFKYLIIKHCNDLNRYMPFMFETIDDYTEILFPDGLLAPDSFVREMTDIEAIPESNWREIEVIGWLYQYYIADEKDRVFKARKKYRAEEIPFATQLFTPEWIVQYMVQNSLGRKWIESHPEHDDLKENWEFYLESQDKNIEGKLAAYINKDLRVEEIKCFDPAMGSGHILVYMFDVLHEIYSKSGYMEREIPRLIIENNLYGLDIDDRAYQLASFSVVMKGMEYNRRFLRSIERHGLTLNLAAIQETNMLTEEDIAYLAGENKGKNFDDTKAFIEQYKHAKSIGSLIKVTQKETSFLLERLQSIKASPDKNLFETDKRDKTLSLLPKLIKQTEIMGQSYDVLVTNPPYMGSRSMNKELTDYLRRNYPDSRRDLFAAFMELDQYLKKGSFYSCINQHSWMFLSSFEKLRKKIILEKHIENMLHLGPRAFEEIGGEVVQSTVFVLRNDKVQNGRGTYLRLRKESTSIEKRKSTIEAIQNSIVSYRYLFAQDNFNKIPGSPIVYWVTHQLIENFADNKEIGEIADFKSGMSTTDNNRFLRYWHEVSNIQISFGSESYSEVISNNKKWVPYNKGGGYKKWYGFNQYVVNWFNNGEEIKRAVVSNPSDPGTTHWSRRVFNHEFFFREGLTWSTLSSGLFSMRYFPNGFIFDSKGASVFFDEENKKLYTLGLLNSKVAETFLSMLSPTLDFNPGQVSKVPFVYSDDKGSIIDGIVQSNIMIAKNDWDSYESSWDFLRHPLIKLTGNMSTIEEVYNQFSMNVEERFNKLKVNEESLNKIFIEIYGLQNELSPKVKDRNVTIRKTDLEQDIKSFISYAIGCSFGRYSLEEEGLIHAGGEFNPSRYEKFHADEDNILPILPGAYFEDDIVSRFVEFVRVTFGESSLEENLDFVANAIKRRKNETARETLRRYFINDFYKDHVQMYKRRPIYWQFTSGREKAFNCLIYMHRYDKTTLSRIRTDYLHEYQIRMDVERQDLVNIIDGDYTTGEINVAKRELTSLDKKIAELKDYDEVLHHMADMQIEIDLDDGVKVNYEKFDGLVAKI